MKFKLIQNRNGKLMTKLNRKIIEVTDKIRVIKILNYTFRSIDTVKYSGWFFILFRSLTQK